MENADMSKQGAYPFLVVAFSGLWTYKKKNKANCEPN